MILGTALIVHVPPFTAQEPTAIDTDVIKHYGVHLSTQALVESDAEIFGDLKNHSAILVNFVDTSRVFVFPIHSELRSTTI
jgi:hypothetical protein